MPTVEVLYAAFAKLEELAPTELPQPSKLPQTTIDLMPGGKRSPRRPRRTFVVVAAAGVAAAVAMVTTVSAGVWGGDKRASSPPAATAPAPVVSSTNAPAPSSPATASTGSTSPSAPAKPVVSTLPYTSNAYTIGALPDGLSVFITTATGGYQDIELWGATEDDADIIVSSASGWHPPIPAGAKAVSVDGRRGYYATKFDLSAKPPIVSADQTTSPGIVFQAGSGRWVFVTQFGQFGTQYAPPRFSEAKLLAIADAVHADGSQPVRTPIKFGYLPGGQQLTQASTIYRPVKGGSADIDIRYQFFPAGNGDYSLNMEINPGTAIMGEEGAAHDLAPQRRAISINGWSGTYSSQDPDVVVTNGAVSVYLSKGSGNIGPGLGIPLADLTRILKGMKAAPSMSDTSTWFTLASAVPKP